MGGCGWVGVGVGVCVNHLNRCKTSTLIGGIVFPYQVLCDDHFTRRLSNLLFICRGVQHLWHTARNEAIAIGGKGRLITSLYLQNSVWTVEQAVQFRGSIFFSVPVRFSQSELLPISLDGTVASSKDVERFLLHCFSRLVIQEFLSGLTEVFFARTMHSTSVIREDISEQVCLSCCIRQVGRNPSGKAFLG